jgi:hypothetical protein
MLQRSVNQEHNFRLIAHVTAASAHYTSLFAATQLGLYGLLVSRVG